MKVAANHLSIFQMIKLQKEMIFTIFQNGKSFFHLNNKVNDLTLKINSIEIERMLLGIWK